MLRKVKRGVKKRVAEGGLLSNLVVLMIVRLAYITGLTLLIPFIFLFLLPTDGVTLWQGTPPTLLIIATVLILVSFVIMFWHKQNMSRTFKALGLMTLIPGLVALLFALFGREAIFAVMQKYIFAPGVETAITLYLNQAIPRIRILTISYMFLGLLMWLMGDKLEKGRGFI